MASARCTVAYVADNDSLRVTRQSRVSSRRWHTSSLWRWRTTCVVAGFLVTALVAWAQVSFPSAFFLLGHSLTLWFLIGLVASSRGSWREAAITSALTLGCSVLVFFFVWDVSDLQITGEFNSVTVIGWILAAPIAGALTSTLSLLGKKSGYGSGLACGVIVGFVLGDWFYTNVGTDFSRIVAVLNPPDVLAVVALLASVIELVLFARRNRAAGNVAFQRSMVAFAPGVAAGCILSFAPLVAHAVINVIYSVV